jgi:3',5'-cyclic AMP phosphodiesterase CpdA
MADVTRIAHFTDIHYSRNEDITIKQLLSKRLYGYIFWKFAKGKRFDFSILNKMPLDLKSEDVDHIVVTGDLTQLALPGEFSGVRDFIFALDRKEKISIIPGNHDFYVFEGKKYYSDTFPEYDSYPYVKIVNNCAIIGVNSSVVTPPIVSYGYLSRLQLNKLSELLNSLDGYFNILLIHHPPIKGITSWKKALVNAKGLTDLLRGGKINMVLHGHTHHFNITYFKTESGNIPIISATALAYHNKLYTHSGGYNIYEISTTDEKWDVVLKRKRFDYANQLFLEEKIQLI